MLSVGPHPRLALQRVKGFKNQRETFNKMSTEPRHSQKSTHPLKVLGRWKVPNGINSLRQNLNSLSRHRVPQKGNLLLSQTELVRVQGELSILQPLEDFLQVSEVFSEGAGIYYQIIHEVV
jgi:hypothetical protein